MKKSSNKYIVEQNVQSKFTNYRIPSAPISKMYIQFLKTADAKKLFHVKANSKYLCNYEVMRVLQQLKDNTQKKHKREGSLATVTYETLRYLQDTECKKQSEESIEKYLMELKRFKLTKMEKLMMLNSPPRSALEIQFVQESEERLTEEEVQSLVEITNKTFPPEY